MIVNFFTSLMVLLQSACSSGSAVAATPKAAGPPTGTVVHGPFEIVAGIKRVSAGGFPNTSPNIFAKRDLSEFQLRWRGKPVATANGNQHFWRVLRLEGTPRPAVLLVTSGLVLASEDADGQLQLTPINAESSSLPAVQWLDSAGGQPGPTENFGLGVVADLQAGTQLTGGRWLRLGSRSVLDLSTLVVAAVDPWVPIVPGVPVTSISREGDHVRAFSPGRTQYVLAAAGTDYSRADRGQAYGLLVVDIKSGIATELRMDRKRFRFAEMDDLDTTWINHHFLWQRDPSGHERLVPRQGFVSLPWRASLKKQVAGGWALRIPRIDAAFVPVLRRLLEREPGLQMAGASAQPDIKVDFTLGGCALQAQGFGVGSRTASNHYLSIWPANDTPAGNPVGCEPSLRRLAALIDAELATGRHDALLKFE